MACRFSCHMARFATCFPPREQRPSTNPLAMRLFSEESTMPNNLSIEPLHRNEIRGGEGRERERASLTRALAAFITRRKNLKKKKENKKRIVLK